MTSHDTYLALDVARREPSEDPQYELVVTFDHLGTTRAPEPMVIPVGRAMSTCDVDLDQVLEEVIDYAAMYLPDDATQLDGDITPVTGRLYANHRATKVGQFVLSIREAS